MNITVQVELVPDKVGHFIQPLLTVYIQYITSTLKAPETKYSPRLVD
jgi:hypothetical protein